MARGAARSGAASSARLADENAELTGDEAGSASADAGPAGHDAGPAGHDAGTAGDDAGPAGHDAGTAGDTGPTEDAPQSAGDQARLAGRYRLEKRLSEQDGSSVWKATDKALARVVSVRTFAPGFRRIGPVVAAARAASQLNDRRLVHIFDADDSADHRYIVSEWPSGERLDDVLVIGPLEPLRAVEIITDAANAISVAHAAGLAHLCLTPDSLWCNTRSEVKIIGLGTAAALAGTQADDPALADTRGLASLLYAALTGYWPGAEETRLPAAPRSDSQLPSPRELRADIPADIDAVTCRALFGAAGGYRPSILSPAGLAVELAAIVASSGSRSYSQAPNVTQPLSLALGRAPSRRRSSVQRGGRPRPDTQPLAMTPSATPDPPIPAARPPIPAARPPIPAARPPTPAAQPPIPAAQPPIPAGQPPAPATRSSAQGTLPPAAPPTPAPGHATTPPAPPTPAPGHATSPPAHLTPPPAHAAPPSAPAAPLPVTPAPAAPAGPGLTAADPDPRPRARAMTGRSAWRAAIAALPTVPAAVAKPLRIVAAILVLAISAAGGWLLAHSGGTAAPRHQATAPVTAPVHHAAGSRTIKPAGAATFDPYGDGHGRGDQAIDASLSTAWHTAWYTTAAFGNLKPGTGLILDLGRPVTITGVKVTLGGRAGADVQVRTGTAATSLTDLQPVARVADAGGQVDLRLARPARGARYVLIWFTKLPPDATGTFQATVYNVSVEGS